MFIKKRGLFGSQFFRLYKKHCASICFCEGFRKLPLMAEEEGKQASSHGERGGKREDREVSDS